jgi:hypothetical protein
MPIIVETVEEEIMKEISADMDIPYNVVKDIVMNGQSGFTKHVIESGGYDSVRWPRFGTFKLKHKFMMIKKHLMGMSPLYQKLYRDMLKKGHIFKDKE